MEIIMCRLLAPKKDRPIQASLGEIKTLGELTMTASKIADSITKGKLNPNGRRTFIKSD